MPDSPASAFFKSRGKPAPSLPVTIKLVRTVGSAQEWADADAVFRFVSDREKSEADAGAAKALGALAAKGETVTPEIRAAYDHAHFLHAALRNKDDGASVFFDGPDEARAMLVDVERIRLLSAYQTWKEQQFPDVIDEKKFKEAVADMGNFSIPDLLTKYGYDITRRLLISSAAIRMTSPTS